MTAARLTRGLRLRPARLCLLAVLAAGGMSVWAGAAPAGAAPRGAAPADPILGLARLAGRFQLAGRVTVATRINGERVRQRFLRTWTFTPRCTAGACATVRLVRQRSGGRDTVTLHRRSPGYYTGSGSFYVPLRCGSRTYRHGELAPFSVAVRVNGARRDQTGAVIATHVNASYSNSSRRNLTPCIAFPGRDAATYHGHLVLPPT
jgi:hypothetical protein